jgi:hypothetical protein
MNCMLGGLEFVDHELLFGPEGEVAERLNADGPIAMPLGLA